MSQQRIKEETMIAKYSPNAICHGSIILKVKSRVGDLRVSNVDIKLRLLRATISF
jgi:hypothetical protein